MFLKLLSVSLLSAGICALASVFFPAKQPVENQIVSTGQWRSPIYRSGDLGHTWIPMDDGLPDDLQVTSLDMLGKRLVLASNNHGVYLSDPQRQHWQQLNISFLPKQNVTNLHVAHGVIYAGVSGKSIYASYDLGLSWTSLNHDLKGSMILSILRAGDRLLVGTDRGVFSLKDGTKTWQQVFQAEWATNMMGAMESLFACTDRGIILSTDGGNSWDLILTEPTGRLVALDDKIVAIFSNQMLKISEDMGKNWTHISQVLIPKNPVQKIVKAGEYLISSQPDGIYVSNDWGGHWEAAYLIRTADPYLALLELSEQWDADDSPKPREQFVDLIVVDGVVYGAFGQINGC